MKVNQLMEIAFNTGVVEVYHKTAMGNLTQLWTAGNVYRINNGKSMKNLSRFMQSTKTLEFIDVIESMYVEKAVTVQGKGNKRKTWACIHLMVYAAEYLDVRFHAEVIDTFVKGKILALRDESGDLFNELNLAIDTKMVSRIGKDNKGMCIQTAKLLNAKIQPTGGCWNSATAAELKERMRLESQLVAAIDMGWISEKEDLWTAIDKL